MYCYGPPDSNDMSDLRYFAHNLFPNHNKIVITKSSDTPPPPPPPYGGIYNELAKSMTSLCSTNTLEEFIMSLQNLCVGIYNELAKSMTSLCSANTLAEFIMS